MKKYKLKLTQQDVKALIELFEQVIANTSKPLPWQDLLNAVLNDMLIILRVFRAKNNEKNTLVLTPVYAFALRLMHVEYFEGDYTYSNNLYRFLDQLSIDIVNYFKNDD